MQIQINFGGSQPQSDALEHEAIVRAREAMARFGDRVTRVEVHLKDANSSKGGRDKQCTMEARIARLDPIAVTHDGLEMMQVIKETADKLQRAVEHRLDRIEKTHTPDRHP